VVAVDKDAIPFFISAWVIASALRILDVKRREDLQLPKLVEGICSMETGLILVTGLAGTGRSATIAAMVRTINTNKHEHITTIDEPIQYFHDQQKPFIEQKQVAIDVADFNLALERALVDRTS
jgi:twitching motility protein PilT